MATEYPTYSRRDDDPHLRGDALAEKVQRYLRYATVIDTSDISVIAIGSMVILTGTVADESAIERAGEAAAAVIGVTRLDNRLTVGEQGGDSPDPAGRLRRD